LIFEIHGPRSSVESDRTPFSGDTPMQSFGETLKAEREDRGLTIESLAQTLSVDQERLRALERNDFAALPDEATMMDCLNAFADCLGVDAEMMIDDYVKERDQWLQQLDREISRQSVPVSRPPWVFGALIAAAAIVILAAWWIFSADGPSPNPPAQPTTDAPELTEPVPVDPPSTQPQDIVASNSEVLAEQARASAPSEAAEVSPVPIVAPTESAPSSTLTIPDSGVGTGIRNRQLIGRGDRFAEGTPVWFWTQIEGGTRGDRIDHIWFHDGVEATRVSLNIGSSRWRTYSTKLLGPGSSGSWAVEAHAESGQLLVRHEFVVESE
jgi:transcriptional regulator with XRE-family HTH domain